MNLRTNELILTKLSVGSNNHRHFVIFVSTLVIGIILFDYLTYACTSFPSSLPPRKSNPISPTRLLYPHPPFPCPLFHKPILHSPHSPLPPRSVRPLPHLRRPLVYPPTLLDPGPPRHPTLANSSSDDHSRGLQPRAVRIYGRAWRVKYERANGSSASAPFEFIWLERSAWCGYGGHGFSGSWCGCWGISA